MRTHAHGIGVEPTQTAAKLAPHRQLQAALAARNNTHLGTLKSPSSHSCCIVTAPDPASHAASSCEQRWRAVRRRTGLERVQQRAAVPRHLREQGRQSCETP